MQTDLALSLRRFLIADESQCVANILRRQVNCTPKRFLVDTTIKRGYNPPRAVNKRTLYLVATPIGNAADLTLRARRVLRECDAVICEERRAGSTLLARLGIEKPLYELNEHTRAAEIDFFVERLGAGDALALISDHGTPLVEDPGAELVQRALAEKIKLVPIPGASAILAALVASGIPAPRFRFLGRLPQKRAERARALDDLGETRETMILLDAPYRLDALLDALRDAFGHARRAAVACNLTLPDEKIVRGTLSELVRAFNANPFKGEFVVIIQGIGKPDKKK